MWSVIDDCRELLALRCVQERAERGARATPEELFEALAAYLEHAVGKLDKFQHRRLLTIVLAIDESYRGTTAKHRRTKAGELFRGADSEPVTAGNIRQHHEPKAIAALADIMHDDESALLDGD